MNTAKVNMLLYQYFCQVNISHFILLPSVGLRIMTLYVFLYPLTG